MLEKEQEPLYSVLPSIASSNGLHLSSDGLTTAYSSET